MIFLTERGATLPPTVQPLPFYRDLGKQYEGKRCVPHLKACLVKDVLGDLCATVKQLMDHMQACRVLIFGPRIYVFWSQALCVRNTCWPSGAGMTPKCASNTLWARASEVHQGHRLSLARIYASRAKARETHTYEIIWQLQHASTAANQDQLHILYLGQADIFPNVWSIYGDWSHPWSFLWSFVNRKQ